MPSSAFRTPCDSEGSTRTTMRCGVATATLSAQPLQNTGYLLAMLSQLLQLCSASAASSRTILSASTRLPAGSLFVSLPSAVRNSTACCSTRLLHFEDAEIGMRGASSTIVSGSFIICHHVTFRPINHANASVCAYVTRCLFHESRKMFLNTVWLVAAEAAEVAVRCEIAMITRTFIAEV